MQWREHAAGTPRCWMLWATGIERAGQVDLAVQHGKEVLLLALLLIGFVGEGDL